VGAEGAVHRRGGVCGETRVVGAYGEVCAQDDHAGKFVDDCGAGWAKVRNAGRFDLAA